MGAKPGAPHSPAPVRRRSQTDTVCDAARLPLVLALPVLEEPVGSGQPQRARSFEGGVCPDTRQDVHAREYTCAADE